MKAILYNRLKEALNKNLEAYVITIIIGNYGGKNIAGQKMFISKNQVVIEAEELKGLWDEIIEKINLENCTHSIIIEDGLEVFVEYIVDRPQLIICGGGHIALPLCTMAKMLDFKTIVIDDREEFANVERFNMADKVICKSFSDVFKGVSFNRNTYFVILTRGHKDDRKCLESIINNQYAYVGMIGSKAKVATVEKIMLENGFKKELLDKVHTPIGLNIGGETPAEIAVSILSEIILVKNKKVTSFIDNEILRLITEKKSNMVLTTIIEKKGSSPRGAGTRMLVLEDGSFFGTVGGGSVEYAVYNKALEVVKNKQSTVELYDLSNSAASKLGMVCGGTVKILFEYI